MKVDIWVDARCPWTFTASRWLVEDVLPAREVTLTWNTMSIYFAKGVDESSPAYEKLWFSHRLSRVVQAIKDGPESDKAGVAYLEFATRIWRFRQWGFEPSEALLAAGLDPAYAGAFSEEAWDMPIRESMQVAYDLIGGDDVGNTPIFGVTDEDGVPMALYGPVLTKRPDAGRSLALWDAIVDTTTNQAFAGLNRKTPELPDFG